MTFRQKLKNLGACPASLAWLRENKIRDLAKAWAKCRDPTWMAWLIQRTSGFQQPGIDYPRLEKLTAKAWKTYDREVNAANEEGDKTYRKINRSLLGFGSYDEALDKMYDDRTRATVKASKKKNRACSDAYRKTIPLAVLRKFL